MGQLNFSHPGRQKTEKKFRKSKRMRQYKNLGQLKSFYPGKQISVVLFIFKGSFL